MLTDGIHVHVLSKLAVPALSSDNEGMRVDLG
jgi:hypothetical protein